MTAIVAERLRDLAATLAELKVRVRAAIASELGRVVGTAVRDVLVVALTHRLVSPIQPAFSAGWSDEEDRDRWDDPHSSRDPWDDDPDGVERRPPPQSPGEVDTTTAVPAAAALAVGVHVGRWWLSRRGGLLGRGRGWRPGRNTRIGHRPRGPRRAGRRCCGRRCPDGFRHARYRPVRRPVIATSVIRP